MRYFSLLFTLLFSYSLSAQTIDLDYYLPDEALNPAIPTPESVLGFQVGEWHLSHDNLVRYLYELSDASDRIQIQEFGRTYEDRPLLLLTISTPEHLDNLEAIQEAHVKRLDPDEAGGNTADLPVVIYQGFSIHGNESSGSNAAALLAYYLAAGQSTELDQLLKQSIILLDPCFNPDGLQRFSTWANMHKSAMANADPQSREFNEVWPGGRTNHYWFDLNRDWLLVQHPESQGRLKMFHEWKPNVLTDHHEMGTNSTFFFQPGVPQRTNPLTPQMNQELTARIGTFHAAALDNVGSLYYSQENFDDYYYGKGSTYPDINGAIGILFEQGSSRGHVQESVNGLVKFPFTIRNQLLTARSTIEGAVAEKENLLNYQREFYTNAAQEADSDSRKAFLFGNADDPNRTHKFIELLQRHQIEVFPLEEDLEMDGQAYMAEASYLVPLEQAQYRLIRTIFETTSEFKDSIFYDVSAWTIPMAFNLPFTAIEKRDFQSDWMGEMLDDADIFKASTLTKSSYAYLVEWSDYQAPYVANQLLKGGLRVKVATEGFMLEGKEYQRGTLMIPVANQRMSEQMLYVYISQLGEDQNIAIQSVATGFTPSGIDLGSNQFRAMRQPKVLIIGGRGAYSYEVGEMWYLLEERLGIQASIVEIDRLHRIDFSRYNVIMMAHGSYSGIEASAVNKLKTWIRSGGTLWCQRGAASWAMQQNLSGAKTKKSEEEAAEGEKEWVPYSRLSADSGSKVIGGAILSAQVDLSHPLLYGFHNENLPLFRRGTLFFENTENSAASPIRYQEEPVLSGYVHADNQKMLQGSPALVVSGQGRGRIIAVADNPNFRAYWYGTQKLTANAIFFGHLISGRALEAIK